MFYTRDLALCVLQRSSSMDYAFFSAALLWALRGLTDCFYAAVRWCLPVLPGIAAVLGQNWPWLLATA